MTTERPDDSAGGEEPRVPRSVLEQVQQRTGMTARVLLRDAGSEHGPTPIVDPTSPEKVRFPASRHHYQVLGEIARGGMGIVLKGQDTDLGREVAIKVLDERFKNEPAVLQRFLEEAQIGGQLQHPGVVPVYELGLMADARPFFAMKLVKGRTLSDLLSARRVLTEDRRRFLAIFESICQTVAYAHSKGVIHRDLKPANVMVGAFGEVQVADWGLAKVLGRGGIEDEQRARRVEHTIIETVRSGPGSTGSNSVVGSVMGTPAYMPPEQAMGEIEKIDERSDVFALGGILCEILTGKPPYVGTEKERTVVQAAHGRLDRARESLAACEAEAELKALALECLAPARTVRPRNADEVARRVQEHLASAEERARSAELRAAEGVVKVAAARRARLLTVGLAAAVVLAVVAVGAGLRSRSQTRIEQVAEVRRKLDVAGTQVLALQQREQLSEAYEVARNAEVFIAESPWADAELRARAIELVRHAEDRVAKETARYAEEERKARFLATLEELRLDQVSLFDVDRQLDLEARFVRVFEDFGVPLRLEDLRPALEALRATGIAEAIAPALDDWSKLWRGLEGADSYQAQSLTALAIDLDPDPDRAEVRMAILAGDREELMALAAVAGERGYSAATMFSLAWALFDLKAEQGALDLLKLGAQTYPDDFLLNYAESLAYSKGLRRNDLALPALRAAAGLRPRNGQVRLSLGEVLAYVGHLPDALDEFAAAEALGVPSDEMTYRRGLILWELGDYAAAVRTLRRAAALQPPDSDEWTDLLAARYLAGELTHEELLADMQMPGVRSRGDHVAYALALVEHPSRTETDDVLALAAAGAARSLGMQDPYLSFAYCSALAHLGNAEELMAEIERWEVGIPVLAPMDNALQSVFRARALHKLGEPARARKYLDLARSRAVDLTSGNQERWRDSRLLRALRAAELELGG